jgi:hypothetical protein
VLVKVVVCDAGLVSQHIVNKINSAIFITKVINAIWVYWLMFLDAVRV